MLFSLQYLAVKDTDLEHALLFSLLKLSIAVLPVRNKACSAVLSLQLPTLHQAVPGHGQQLYAAQGHEVLLAHSWRWAQLAAPPHQEPMPVPVAGQDLKKDISSPILNTALSLCLRGWVLEKTDMLCWKRTLRKALRRSIDKYIYLKII